MQEGRTMLVVAHRMSTVVDADEIVVLDDGVAVERGSSGSRVFRTARFIS